MQQQCWNRYVLLHHLPLPRFDYSNQALWKKILRILRYRFNQILTINNSFEILQPVFFQDCNTLKCTWRKYCSSVESNASSLINSLHGLTTPTWFLESTSARDEMNVKWFYRPVLLVIYHLKIPVTVSFQSNACSEYFY